MVIETFLPRQSSDVRADKITQRQGKGGPVSFAPSIQIYASEELGLARGSRSKQALSMKCRVTDSQVDRSAEKMRCMSANAYARDVSGYGCGFAANANR